MPLSPLPQRQQRGRERPGPQRLLRCSDLDDVCKVPGKVPPAILHLLTLQRTGWASSSRGLSPFHLRNRVGNHAARLALPRLVSWAGLVQQPCVSCWPVHSCPLAGAEATAMHVAGRQDGDFLCNPRTVCVYVCVPCTLSHFTWPERLEEENSERSKEAPQTEGVIIIITMIIVIKIILLA